MAEEDKSAKSLEDFVTEHYNRQKVVIWVFYHNDNSSKIIKIVEI